VNIWGSPPPQKKREIAKIGNFFAPQANPLPDVGEIYSIYAGNPSTEVINIWCASVGKLGIYMQKKRDGAFLPKFSESSSSETTGPIEKSSGAKMVRTSSIFTQGLVEIRRYTAA